MKVDIGSDYTEVSINQNGIRKSKLVSLSDLLDELSAYRTTNYGMLPRSTRFIESAGNHIVLGLEFGPQKRNLSFRGEEGPETVEGCNVPGGMMFVKLRRDAGGSLTMVNSSIYAFKGNRISFPNDRLYGLPFPNVYDNGRICWGAVRVGEITALLAVEGFISSFFTNNFNSDLFGYAKFDESYEGPRGNFRKFFHYIAEHDFDDDWLVSSDYNVDQVVAELLQNRG